MWPEPDTVLDLERSWLDRWIKGDPSGYLALCADDVRYFDSFLGGWIDGLAALGQHLEQLRGKIILDSYDLEAHRVMQTGETTIVSYVWIGHAAGSDARWCASDTYRLSDGRPRIIQGVWIET